MTGQGPSVAPPPGADTGAERRREQRGWYFYDWANSAFSTTVVTVFLGPYLTSVAEAGAVDGDVTLLGLSVSAESYFPYVVSISVVLQVLLLPLVGAIADRVPRKRLVMGVLAYVGALATMSMFFLAGDNYHLGGALLVVANLAFGASVVVYNSFLPDIADPDERDAVSSRGWALGYLGGGLLLVANLVLYTMRDSLGVSEGDAVRISLLSAGAWWALFTIIPLRRLRDRPPRNAATGASAVTAGFRQLATTFREARGYPMTLLFLLAYLLYNDGIQTVIALAATYGAEELDLSNTTLITAVLVVQLVAFIGALALGRLAYRFGTKRTILGSLVVWAIVVGIAYFLPAGSAVPFYLLAVLIGFVLGGSQALSRSLFSQLIPRSQEAEYFSLYEISERGTSWIGTFLFAVTLDVTGSYRTAIIALVVFFVAGGLVLTRVDIRRAIREAGNPEPAVV
ncbi:MAG: MFS transporter [Candidatus Nanopelagicales bacterium]